MVPQPGFAGARPLHSRVDRRYRGNRLKVALERAPAMRIIFPIRCAAARAASTNHFFNTTR